MLPGDTVSSLGFDFWRSQLTTVMVGEGNIVCKAAGERRDAKKPWEGREASRGHGRSD